MRKSLALLLLLSVAMTGGQVTAQQQDQLQAQEMVPEIGPNVREQAIDRALAQGYLNLLRERYLDAIPHYQLALTLTTERADIWREYATVMRNTGHIQRSARAAWQSIRLDDDNASAWRVLAETLIHGRAYGRAAQALKKSQTLGSPEGVMLNLWAELGFKAWVAKDGELTKRCFDQAAEIDAEDYRVRLGRALVRFVHGRAGAGALLEQLILDANETDDATMAQQSSILYQEYRNHGRLRYPVTQHRYSQLPKRFQQALGNGWPELDEKTLHGIPVHYDMAVELELPEFWHTEELDVEDIEPSATGLRIATGEAGDLSLDLILMPHPIPGDEIKAYANLLYQHILDREGIEWRSPSGTFYEGPYGNTYSLRLFHPAAFSAKPGGDLLAPYTFIAAAEHPHVGILVTASSWKHDHEALEGLLGVLSQLKVVRSNENQ